MADIKTILRETSVIFGLKDIPVDKISVTDYILFLKNNLNNYDKNAIEIDKLNSLNNFDDYQYILNNGFRIGKDIRKAMNYAGDINWIGADVNSKYPYDIKIGNNGISLKEHSYILKNPALSDYINSLTQYKPPFKTVHIFRLYAAKLFEEWFSYTLKRLFETTKDGIVIDNLKRECKLIRAGDDIIFSVNNTSTTIKKTDKINEVEFNRKVGGYLIEHTFSKWINFKLDDDNEYIRLKKACSETAGENLKDFIEKNLNIDKKSICGLFQIYDDNYLYAKVGTPPILLEVPSFDEVDVELDSIVVLVPKSQLNVHFKFKFIANEKISHITVRVECRYSHGQFKGVPEAKLYYTDNDEIGNIYKRINVDEK